MPVDRWPGTDNPARPELHVPAGGARRVPPRVSAAWGNEDLIENAFELREYDPGDVSSVGPLRVRFHPVPHFVPTTPSSLARTNGGGRFTYGADCAPNDELVDFAAAPTCS